MFIEKEELYSAIYQHTLGGITADDSVVHLAILAAIEEASSYLNARYDCQAIFNAQGDARNILVLEHCKSMAVWYILRLSNANVFYEKAKAYYDNAIGWFRDVAGVGESGKTIAPILPLKKVDGIVKTQLRSGSNRKFNHHFDD